MSVSSSMRRGMSKTSTLERLVDNKPRQTHKKLRRRVQRMLATARLLSGLLLRAAGHDSELVLTVGGCAYKRRIARTGTTISPATRYED